MLLLTAGCVTPAAVDGPVVEQADMMTFMEAGLRPEVPLFPGFLLMECFELHQHGRVPGTPWIGGDISCEFSLGRMWNVLSRELERAGWVPEKVELERSSFRYKGALEDQSLEIRAVRGTAQTRVFILYHPGMELAVARK